MIETESNRASQKNCRYLKNNDIDELSWHDFHLFLADQLVKLIYK